MLQEPRFLTAEQYLLVTLIVQLAGIAALSTMTGVKVETLDRLIGGERYDPILIAGKSLDLEWATVRALILLRLGPSRTASPTDIEDARVNYMRLMPSTAQRVVAFWKTR